MAAHWAHPARPTLLAPSRLPDDLVDQSLRRLANIALTTAIVFIVGTAASVISVLFTDWVPSETMMWTPRIAFIAASLLIYGTLRHSPLDRRIKSDLGLIYEVFASGAVVILELGIFQAFDMQMGSTSFVVVWIFFMRLMVPVDLLRAALAAGLSAAIVPLAYWFWCTTHADPVQSMILGGLIKTTTAAALLAVLASRAVYRLGRQVHEAREMGAYQLEKLLGEGGMGQVWQASHRMLQRPAAIKLIRPEVLGFDDRGKTGSTQQRFEREAQATARLTSVHTVQLFDYGKTDDGSFFYVMELLDGLDLETLINRFGPVFPERAVFLLDQICHSLEDAHGHELIHRDVKPANIFLCRLGPDHDFIKVLDFGLVKETVEAEDNPKLTQDQQAPGTPAFMAPEVVTGTAPGAHTDIYAIGCVGYWLLTGSLVFEGATSLEILTKHVSEPPVPPSRRTELAMPPELEQLILDCLAKDPADRPASAADVARRLRDIPLERPWSRDRALRWWQTHRPTDAKD